MPQGGEAYVMNSVAEHVSKNWVDTAPRLAPARSEEIVTLNPLTYSSWDSQVAAHSGCTFFHSSAWVRVLRETYGHRPFYFCRLVDGRLKAILPVMEVSSLWTGRRGVSLPFTDACPSLGTEGGDHACLHDQAIKLGRERNWRYLECKSNRRDWPGSSPAIAFYGHVVPLERRLPAIFDGFQSATQRNIRRAEAARLKITFSTCHASLCTFYALHNLTRRRHGLPPQGFGFFENIRRHVLALGQGFIVTAQLGDVPVAAAIFFHQGRQAIFKFGASNYALQNLRANNLVIWEAIKRYASEGFTHLHLGRTSLCNQGLRRFKRGFGAREERIENCRYDLEKHAFAPENQPAKETSSYLFRCLPLPLLRLAGRMLYPHLS